MQALVRALNSRVKELSSIIEIDRLRYFNWGVWFGWNKYSCLPKPWTDFDGKCNVKFLIPRYRTLRINGADWLQVAGREWDFTLRKPTLKALPVTLKIIQIFRNILYSYNRNKQIVKYIKPTILSVIEDQRITFAHQSFYERAIYHLKGNGSAHTNIASLAKKALPRKPTIWGQSAQNGLYLAFAIPFAITVP